MRPLIEAMKTMEQPVFDLIMALSTGCELPDYKRRAGPNPPAPPNSILLLGPILVKPVAAKLSGAHGLVTDEGAGQVYINETPENLNVITFDREVRAGVKK
jgi:hypothetical protein